ncbi:MAG: sigma-70 family RNA polymerase sigma factor [Myxococcota bacterium]
MPTQQELPAETIHEALWGELPGSRRAFARLYDYYEPAVRYGVARAAQHARYSHRIEELQQEVWVCLLARDRKLLRYYRSECGPLGAFLNRVAYQQALNAIRRDRRQLVGNSYDEVVERVFAEEVADEEALAFVAHLSQSDVYRKLLARAYAELDDLDRLMIREVYQGQRRFSDIAREVGVAPNRLYKRNQRLRERLVMWCNELLGSTDPDALELADVLDSASSSTLLVAVVLVGLALAHPAELGSLRSCPSSSAVPLPAPSPVFFTRSLHPLPSPAPFK